MKGPAGFEKNYQSMIHAGTRGQNTGNINGDSVNIGNSIGYNDYGYNGYGSYGYGGYGDYGTNSKLLQDPIGLQQVQSPEPYVLKYCLFYFY